MKKVPEAIAKSGTPQKLVAYTPNGNIVIFCGAFDMAEVGGECVPVIREPGEDVVLDARWVITSRQGLFYDPRRNPCLSDDVREWLAENRWWPRRGFL